MRTATRKSFGTSLATWIVEHAVPGDSNASLAGDLLEELAQGQSRGWYWRQVLAALLTGYARQLKTQWPAVLFAIAWSMSAPGLELLRMRQYEGFEDRVWQMSWPWSTIIDLSWSLGMALVCLWTGLLLYVAFYSAVMRTVSLRRLMRGMFLCVPLFALACAMMSLVMNCIPNRGWINLQETNYVGLITKPVFIPLDIAFCLPLIVSICAALPRVRHRAKAPVR